MHCRNFLASCSWLIRDGVWFTTPITPKSNPRFSRDNWAGVMAGLDCVIMYAKQNGIQDTERDAINLMLQVPVFHKQLDHPRDFVMAGYFKLPILFWPLLPIMSLSFIVSCWQSHKKRHGIKIPKTDGKIIAFIICKAFRLRLTFWICDKLIRYKNRPEPIPASYGKKIFDQNSWQWGSWHNVFSDYYRNFNHPNIQLIRSYEVKYGK